MCNTCLTEHAQQPQYHSYIKQIDEWKQESINKIHRVANDARQQIKNLINEHTTELTESLTKIALELRKAREDDDFYDTDLQQWMGKLNKLKKDFAQISNINIIQEDSSIISFIPKVSLPKSSKETFGQSIGNIRIENNGQVIVKDQSDSYATVRSNGEYASGQHRFRFKIEANGPDKWLFIGIASKNAPIKEASYCIQSSYGWSGDNRVYISGAHQPGFNGYKGDIEKNDIVELFIDCDYRSIQLTNERTRSVHTLAIDMNKCQFPWQLNFNLFYLNDRVSILQT
ncbi:unnamed protein product [Rotaria sordida]|uniref:B30.2/SPRY domain-containing protein n=1 Tax=Rotaria sordida TaxID=392033 RepID=A0A815FYD3_9BILA|nr:unnamed protein product [Rotaria sordida]